MGAILTRLKRLVREANERQREKDEEHERYMAMITGALLGHCPGLRLVEPCDTDPETYARIQEIIAESERRTADAMRWRRVYEPVPPPKYAGTTQEDFRDFLNAMTAASSGRCEREQLAIKAAYRRTGKAPAERAYEPMPEPLE